MIFEGKDKRKMALVSFLYQFMGGVLNHVSTTFNYIILISIHFYTGLTVQFVHKMIRSIAVDLSNYRLII